MFKIKVPAVLISSEACLLGLQVAAFSLPLHMVVSVCTLPSVNFCVQISSSIRVNDLGPK